MTIIALTLAIGIALMLSAEWQLRLARTDYAIVHRHGNAGLYLVLGSLVAGGLAVVL